MTIAMRKGFEEWKSQHPGEQTAWAGFIGAWITQQNIINHLQAENTRLRLDLQNAITARAIGLPYLSEQPDSGLPRLQQPGEGSVQVPGMRVSGLAAGVE